MKVLDAAKARADGIKKRLLMRRWISHLAETGAHYKANRGDHYAAAITYFSFLALFPLILLLVAVTGFVLKSRPDLQQDLFENIAANMPGGLGDTITESVQTAIDKRAGVGIVGLIGVLYTGLGWIGNLRQAIEGVWGTAYEKVGFLRSKAANLFVLGVLGIAAIVSLSMTAVGTALTDQIMRWLGIEDVFGMTFLLKAAGIVLPVLGDMLIFAWVLVWLPKTPVRGRIIWQGTLMAAVGFELLKIVGTYYMSYVATSPTAGLFGSVIGFLVWIFFVSRWVLFCAAWLATAVESQAVLAHFREKDAPALPAPETAPQPAETPAPAISPAGVAGSIFGAGVAVGAGLRYLISARNRR